MRAAPESSAVRWRKSSYSGGQEGSECVEVADGIAGLVPVRDSKDPHGPALVFTDAAWSSFLGGLKRGELPAS